MSKLKLEPQKEQILKWYDEGKTCYWISQQLGEYEQAVSNLVKRYRNVPKWEPYKINEDYFKTIDSVDKAYHFGLIAADGAMVKATKSTWTMTISLQERDAHILHKMKRDMEAENPIATYTQQHRGRDTEFYTQSRLLISNQKFCKHLFDKDITPRKSKTLVGLSNHVQEEFIPDYIRGFFEGNGSISRTITSGEQLRNYVSFRGSEEILQDIKSSLGIEGGKIFFGKGSTPNTGTYTWRFGAKEDVIKFKDMIYHDKVGDLYFPRKKDNFLW